MDGQQDTTRTAMKLMTHGGQFYPLTRYYGLDTWPWARVNHVNLGAAVPRDGLMYNRVGSLVSVSGCITLTPATENAVTQLQLSIPVPSGFTGVTDAAGFCSGVQEPMMTGVIWSDPTADNVLIQFKSTVKVTVQARISFTYQIK